MGSVRQYTTPSVVVYACAWIPSRTELAPARRSLPAQSLRLRVDAPLARSLRLRVDPPLARSLHLRVDPLLAWSLRLRVDPLSHGACAATIDAPPVRMRSAFAHRDCSAIAPILEYFRINYWHVRRGQNEQPVDCLFPLPHPYFF